MTIADRYTAPDTRSRFERWLDSLTPEHADIVFTWLNDSTIPHSKIMDLIRDDDPDDGFVGYRATKDTISIWRRTNVAG